MMGFSSGIIISERKNKLQTAYGYAVAGYFLPLTIAYQGIKYWYNKEKEI